MSQLTQEHLKTQLHYDPLTGALSWLVNRGPRARAGTLAGCRLPQGYMQITLNGKHYLQHRLIWLYVTGVMPNITQDIDHIDNDKSNNAWDNLRLCSRSANMRNTLKRSTNTSGHKGVSFCTTTCKWRAQVLVDGVHHGSSHSTKEEAALAAINLRNMLHGEFVNHGFS